MMRLERSFLPRNQALGFGALLETWPKEKLLQFTEGIATPTSLLTQGRKRADSFSLEQRTALYEALKKQYHRAGSPLPEHLERLTLPKTVTITSGHQLSLALGPMFMVYKILHTVALCQRMQQETEEITFLPVFWMATEDHDLAEIQQVHFFNKTVVWNPDAQGPVGRMDTNALGECYAQITSLFKEETRKELEEILEINRPTYGLHFHRLLAKVFGKFGLVLVDGDDPNLKKSLIPWMEQEVESGFLQHEVSKTNVLLEKAGSNPQALVRPINVFYMSPGKRERIIPTENGYQAGDFTWTKSELLNNLREKPEDFSPNVLFRPLYQEILLPNVCYVGGSGEMNYWVQLKSSFERANIPFPLLKTRISGFLLKTIEDKEGISEAFQPLTEQENRVLSRDSSRDALFQELQEEFSALKETMLRGISSFGSEAEKWAIPPIKTIETNLEHYKTRWQKQEKQNLESTISRLRRGFEEKYPGGMPQERVTSFLNYCGDMRPQVLLEELLMGIDPFSDELHLFFQRRNE